MRPVRLILVTFCLCLMALFEREHPLIPLTWILLVYFSLRFKFSLLLTLCFSLFADVAMALPLGLSAIICAGFLACISFAPKKIQWRALFFAILGALVGGLYGASRQSLSLELILSSSVFCAIVYSVGSSFASIEEIGNVQN